MFTTSLAGAGFLSKVMILVGESLLGWPDAIDILN